MVGKHDETDGDAVVESLKDREHFAVLIDRYEAKLARYLRRLGVANLEDRQDILQDVFIKVYRNLHAFDQSLSFSSWIYRIAHNETMSWFRKRSVRPEHTNAQDGDAVLALLASEENIESAHIALESDELVRETVDGLPPRYRDVLILRFFEGKTYEEIADILEVPIGTVATLVHRAKVKLRELLAEKDI